jgi:hypothetical protein
MRVPVRRRRTLLVTTALAVGAAAALPGVASAHDKFDHSFGGFSESAPLSSAANSGGEGAEWELVTTIPTGNLHTDLDFFTSGGETYAAVGTLAVGLNEGGQSIIQLTQDGEVDPSYVTGHPSASCISNPEAALGLQHDVEATPKSPEQISNASYLAPVGGDAQLLLDATDAEGRCHDQGGLGLINPPRGGLEVIDITDVEAPVEIALTSHIGEAHTVHVDPKRPHIAYAVTSDSVSTSVDDEGNRVRNNEDPESSARFNLDGFEVVDLSSCMTAPFGTMPEGLTTDEKREQCKPEVYRYRFDSIDWSLGHTLPGSVYGCHELDIQADDILTCGSGAALIVLDMSGAFDANGKPVGTPLPCSERASSTEGPTATGATVIDCVNGTDERSLDVANWLVDGAESLEGVEYQGSIFHTGRAATNQIPPFGPAEDIDFNHEAERTRSGQYLLATDERGGGVLPPDAGCDPADVNQLGNGGLHAYKISDLMTERPENAEEAQSAYATTLAGERAVHRAPVRTQPQATVCTAHVMQQVPGQNRIFMGWYSQGTQVVDYVELPNGQLEFQEAGYFIPENANTWTSHVFKADENEDGTFTYYGATGDFNLGAAGRNAIDIYKVTLPAPPTPCDLAPEAAVEDRDQVREVHQPGVDCVLHFDISKGKTETTYDPLSEVTREQMASFIVRAIEASGAGDRLPEAPATDRFGDIGDSFHKDAINRLAATGIVEGRTATTYAPKDFVTRQQMASFVVRAARFISGDALEPERDDYFADVPAGSTHARNINAGWEDGLFSGTTAPTAGLPNSGTFATTPDVVRDQMATFLARLFEQKMQVG